MGRGPHTVPLRALLRHAGWACTAAATPAGAGPAAAPPRLAVPSGGGGGASPRLRTGGGPLLWLPSWGGRRGGVGGPPPPPGEASPAFRCPRRAPLGYTRAVGVAGQPRASARSGRPPTGQCGGGGGGGGLVRAPVFPGPASDKAALFAPSWASPVRCRPAAGRACGRLPRPWCPRTSGAAASSGGVWGRRYSVCLRPLLGLSGRGGGEWGGASRPLATPPDGRGGGGMAVPAPGASHRLGGRTLPPPPSTQSRTLVQALAEASDPPSRRHAALAGQGRP